MDTRFQEGGDSETPRRKDDGQALLRACLENDWKKAETLIKAGSFLGARCEAGRTPLMHACLKGKETVVQLLIDKGADPQVMDKRGDTCLHFLETLRNQTILQYILNKYQALGVSVDVESLHSECSPLSISCVHGAVNSAELLLKYGANPNGCENGKHRPLVDACTHGHVRLVKSLLIRGAKVNATGKNGVPPLLQACNNHHWVVAQILMDEGADINQCGIDCTSPLFAAVSANAYQIAESLINKGANVNTVRFQPGAVEGIVEISALAHAAGKGLKTMVKLLIDNGANVNYLCSDTITAVGCSILGDQFETFHFLLECDSLDKSILGLSSSIITSVMREKYYFTSHLLNLLGGVQTAMMGAQQMQMEQLRNCILMYMQAVDHDELPEVSLMLEHFKAPAVVRPHPEDQHKIDEVLIKFCRICVSAILESPDIPYDSLAEMAQATGNESVERFFRTVLSSTMSPEAMRCDFLSGTTSPLRFLIENKILTIEIFQVEVLKFHPDGGHQFYRDLVWTFQHMTGGAELPTNAHTMLTQLFSGRFIPAVSQRRSLNEGPREPMNEPAVPEQKNLTPDQEHVQSSADTANILVWKPFCFKGINCKLCAIPTQHTDKVQLKVDANLYTKSAEELNNAYSAPSSSTESDKSNVSLPSDKSKSAQNVVQNVGNNIPDTTDTNSDYAVSPPQSAQTTKVLPPPLTFSAGAAADLPPVHSAPGDTPESDCHYQEEIEVTQEVAGSNKTRVKSSFPGNIFILEYFFLYVERESDDVIVYSKSIDVVNRDDVVNGLEPMVRYSVTIATQDVNKYADYSPPEDIKVTENLPGSSQATVEWSFLAKCTNLSQFKIILRKEDCGEVHLVDEVVVAAQKRQALIDGLKPSTKYSVTVAAEYSDGTLRQRSKEHMTCDYFKEDVIHFQSHSLPIVKKYFYFADALELSFLQPIDVVTLTNEGKVVTKEGISICVPDDAVPVGTRLHMEVGSAMHGRLSFPKGMQPVSPILWICPQEELDLLKPLRITLPHTVKYEEGVTELYFLKACHNEDLTMTTGITKWEVCDFEEITCHEGIEFNEKNGSVYTKLFCCVCIAENVEIPTKKRYLLHRTQPHKWNTREFTVDYCITFDLSTCVQTFCKFCEKRQLDVRCGWPEFTFESEVQLNYNTALPPTSSWIVDVRSEKTTITEDEVDFWKYKKDIKKLSCFQHLRRYPPKITLDFVESTDVSPCKVGIYFSGASRSLKDSIILLPRENDVMDTNMAVPGSSASAPVHPARPYTHAELLATVPVPQQVASTAVPQLCALGMDDLVEVTGYLKDLNKPQIYNLGLVLGLDYCHVVDLRDNCGCNQYFLDAVVVRWLQRVDRVKDVSWTALITALQNDRLRQTGIADKIAAQHGMDVDSRQ